MFKDVFDNVSVTKPLIHNITNYVTVNDCANILLACGASPIMADDINEVEEITSMCNGLNINIGTLNDRTIKSMLIAGKKANKLNNPVLLDPVGVGSSNLRTDTALKLIHEVKISVIRGNISEIKTLSLGTGSTKGVDADVSDVVNNSNINSVIDFAKNFSKETGAIIVITGAIDIVADENIAYCIFNGHSEMSKVTGTGCQLSALITAFISANKTQMLKAVAAAVCSMGICGEIAHKRLSNFDGNSSYRSYIIDAVYNLTPDILEKEAKYEIR